MVGGWRKKGEKLSGKDQRQRLRGEEGRREERKSE